MEPAAFLHENQDPRCLCGQRVFPAMVVKCAQSDTRQSVECRQLAPLVVVERVQFSEREGGKMGKGAHHLAARQVRVFDAERRDGAQIGQATPVDVA